MMADSLKDTTEQALQWMALYGGLGDVSITVGVNKEFGLTMLTPEMVKAMQIDVDAGRMSAETYIEELKTRGVLRSDLDTQAELDRIAAQSPALTGEALGLD
jgi:predicted deacylase